VCQVRVLPGLATPFSPTMTSIIADEIQRIETLDLIIAFS
jgi:hypothetical protein